MESQEILVKFSWNLYCEYIKGPTYAAYIVLQKSINLKERFASKMF